jgi:hypothetical protein
MFQLKRNGCVIRGRIQIYFVGLYMSVQSLYTYIYISKQTQSVNYIKGKFVKAEVLEICTTLTPQNKAT